MRRICIDTNLWDTPRAIKLEKTLGEPDAWRYLVRLWAWGIDSDCESGIVELTPRRLAQVAGFVGDPVFFINALVLSKFLQQTPTGAFYMCGWTEKYKRYFSEKTRLKQVDLDRKERRKAEKEQKEHRASIRKQKEKRATRGTTQKSCVDPCVSSSSSSVPTEPLFLSSKNEKKYVEDAKHNERMAFGTPPNFPISTPEDFELLARHVWRWNYNHCKLKPDSRQKAMEILLSSPMSQEEADKVFRQCSDEKCPWVNLAIHKLGDIRRPKNVVPFARRLTNQDVRESNIRAIESASERFAASGGEDPLLELAAELDRQRELRQAAGGQNV